ncbi:hypothetical protein CDL12_02842 [Handroanthus impetiginosus]|uniref:Uncharacterized protein n=1 Tax=Handroanthus impetiginosus TaxID=429701 RepID=A0A2G9I3V1_9LAMI|nr:hypothetical protein CDL12_02842 [Handroanthus impetiginosus]
MSEFNNGKSKTTWRIYSSSNGTRDQKEGSWKSLDTSMNAISFKFVVTVILISMFVIMAIFEHLFKPNASVIGMGDRDWVQGLGSPRFVRVPSLIMNLCLS